MHNRQGVWGLPDTSPQLQRVHAFNHLGEGCREDIVAQDSRKFLILNTVLPLVLLA